MRLHPHRLFIVVSIITCVIGGLISITNNPGDDLLVSFKKVTAFEVNQTETGATLAYHYTVLGEDQNLWVFVDLGGDKTVDQILWKDGKYEWRTTYTSHINLSSHSKMSPKLAQRLFKKVLAMPQPLAQEHSTRQLLATMANEPRSSERATISLTMDDEHFAHLEPKGVKVIMVGEEKNMKRIVRIPDTMRISLEDDGRAAVISKDERKCFVIVCVKPYGTPWHTWQIFYLERTPVGYIQEFDVTVDGLDDDSFEEDLRNIAYAE
jgi:hypothetical protein